MTAAAARAASWSGRCPAVIAERINVSNSLGEAPAQGEARCIPFGCLREHGPGEAPFAERAGGKAHDGCGERRQRPRRGRSSSVERRDFPDRRPRRSRLRRGPPWTGNSGRRCLPRSRSLRDRHDLHRRNTPFRRQRACRREDCVLPGGEAGNHAIGAAIGHGRFRNQGSEDQASGSASSDYACSHSRLDIRTPGLPILIPDA